MLAKMTASFVVFLFFCATAGFGQTLYDTFDKPPRKLHLISKSGVKEVQSLLVKNPEKDPNNRSDSCVEYKRFSHIKYDHLKMNPGLLENVGAYLKGKKKITILFYSPAAGVTIELILEHAPTSNGDYPKGRHSIFRTVTLSENAWELLTFEYIFQPDVETDPAGINQFVLQIAPGSNNGDTYYFDNLKGPGF
jgi:hypothetical protein